ncbi:MAG: ABC transporter permease [Deltaproteobacteria bacterium RBG_13_52_11b]|nr:MAG: ABC transporter permease [Deltaproteobacteria bacterium RBG_13_52_11b]
MFGKIRHLFVKELTQVLRDKRMRATLIVPPVLQLIIFGYAANLDVKHIRTAVRDLDRTVESRDLVGRFGSSRYFKIVSYPGTPEEIERLIMKEEIFLSIEIPSGFSRRLKKGDTAHIQIIMDGTESNTAFIALGYLGRILNEYSSTILLKKLNRQGMFDFEEAGVELEHRIWFNPNLESRIFYIPGVIASIAFLIPIILTAQAIVREREIGTLEQIMVTPLRPWQLMIGKTLPFAVIGFLDVVMIALIGIFWFEVPLRGNPFILLLGTLLFLMSSVSIGLFISTVSSTQQQSQISTFFFTMPAFILSGFAFPLENMPEWIQTLTYVNPLRYFLVIIRGVFLKGIGLDILWPQMLALAILGGLMILLSSLRFQKRLK